MQGDAVWQIITFLLNSILFLLIGLQLPVILDDLRGADFDTSDLLRYGGAVTATVIATAHRLGLRLQYSPLHVQARRERAGAAWRVTAGHRVDGDARRRLAGRRARAPDEDRLPASRSPSDPDHLRPRSA